MQEKLVSIIMPTYNAETYIAEAIESVLNQSHLNWELLITDDGSSDDTKSIIQSYNDPRIHYFYQENKGVSSARNVGLKHMKGNFFCFLDADDVYPPNSLQVRLKLFTTDPEADFVDGKVHYHTENMLPSDRIYTPNFTGFPKRPLLAMKDICHFGPSWMIKRDESISYHFEEDMKYSEDIFFILSICNQKKIKYTHVDDVILNYRSGHGSAMQNFRGLEDGYQRFIKKVRTKINCSGIQFWKMKFKIIKIMFLTHLFDAKKPIDAIRIVPKYLFA